MLRRLYNGTMALASGPYAVPALAGVAFAESSFFPIPPDVVLIPMVLAERAKAWWYAFIATLSSVIGALAGYAIGIFLFEAIAQPLIDFYGYGEQYATFQTWFADQGAWIVLFAGVTPFPFKLITIACGRGRTCHCRCSSLPVSSHEASGSGSSPGFSISSVRRSGISSSGGLAWFSPSSSCS